MASHGQRLSGKITEKETGEPISFANAFFAGSLIGGTSDLSGNYSFEGFDAGKYDFTVSYVGYETFTASLEFSENESKILNVELDFSTVKLPEIYVNTDTVNRAINYQVFLKHFIGVSPNAKQTELRNANAGNLHLYYDEPNKELFAHASEPLVIANTALGYEIEYQLVQFQIDLKNGLLWSFGIPRFSEMNPKNSRQEKKWIKNRNKAYFGSLNHFMRSLVADNLEEEEFIVREIYRLPNKDRKPQELIRHKYSIWKKQLYEFQKMKVKKSVRDSANIVFGDSLSYWGGQLNMPTMIDSIGVTIKSKDQLSFNETNELTLDCLLEVEYSGEKEDIDYLVYIRRVGAQQNQTSRINTEGRSIRIYPNGYYEDVRSLITTGYMSWLSGLADMMPLDYEPAE